MRFTTFTRLVVTATLMASAGRGQSVKQEFDALESAARDWMRHASAGDRAELLESTIPEFIATTPNGEVVVRENLIPTSPDQAVQRLPPLEWDSLLPLLLGDTGVVMGRLKVAGDPGLHATFVFVRREKAWKLAAIHLSQAR